MALILSAAIRERRSAELFSVRRQLRAWRATKRPAIGNREISN